MIGGRRWSVMVVLCSRKLQVRFTKSGDGRRLVKLGVVQVVQWRSMLANGRER
ncbi:hypothetical protein Hanom_Chr02g00116181 [Helianthus anomalus]